MIKVLTGDILQSSAQTLVNTVNCVGIMGKGIALEFKKHFPEMFKDYETRCQRNEVKLGRPYLYRTLFSPWILNFPTKDDWRSVSRLEDIIRGLQFLIDHYKEWGITSIAVPPLGCGHGQLEWRIVGPTLHKYLSQLEIPVELYAPYGIPHEELQQEFLSQQLMPSPKWIQPAWIALVEILRRVEKEPYHWPVGRTIFQKMAFVATYLGIPTGLQHEKKSYGPFSSQLKQIITKLANNGLIREEHLGQMFSIKVGPTFGAASKAYRADLLQWEPEIEKVVDLFMRLHTKQSELVATVLYAANELKEDEERRPTELEVFQHVMAWKAKRRPPLEEHDVADTIRNLAALGWLNVKPSADLPVPEDEFTCV